MAAIDEFPKALTNENGDQIIVGDADEETAAAKDGYYFGGVKPEAKKRAAKAD